MARRHGRGLVVLLVLTVVALLGCGTGGTARTAARSSPPVVSSSAAWVDKLVADMQAANAAHPHGVPPSYSFYERPELDRALPAPGMHAVTGWGVVYEAAEGSHATNTRVEVRNVRLYLWSNREHRWIEAQDSTTPAGADYPEPAIAGELSNSASPADVQAEPDGGAAVRMQAGQFFHFWPADGRTVIDRSDVGGAFTVFEARLVKDDPQGPDDTASARYVASAGADWWATVDAPWPQNAQAFFGRFSYVTTAWSTFTGTTWTATQLRVDPPPAAA